VFESCVPVNPVINQQLSQIIQDSPLSFTINVNQVFKDKNGVCWRYVGRFGSNYIPPANVTYSTQSGNYFVGASSTIYNNCTTCIQTPPPCTTRPTGLNKYALLGGYSGPQIPSVYNEFRSSSVSAACDAWQYYSANPNKLILQTGFQRVEGFGVNIGDVLYVGYDQTNCEKAFPGNWWLLNSTYPSPPQFSSNNPYQPNVVIVTVGFGGVITNITTCYYLP
jgi:hypothetical protein